MELKDLYNCIKNKKVSDDLIIFSYKKNGSFIAYQYINEIANQKNLNIKIIDDLSQVKTEFNMFDSLVVNNELYVYYFEKPAPSKFDCDNANLIKSKNVIICCEGVSSATEKLFKDYIVKIPELEEWQLKDFLYSKLEGIDSKYLDWLYNNSKDPYRINQEIKRLEIFSDVDKNQIFNQFKNDGIYSDLSDSTIFDFINAIVKKDINKIASLYKQLNNLDFSPMGFLANLYNNFRNIISVQLNPYATAESCGFNNSKQFWAIKNYCIGFYSQEQLANIFKLLTEVELKIRLGQLSMDYILDYLLVKILTF